MRTGFRLGDFELTWLNGGRFELDGGAMFGVVPKSLWKKKYPADDENYIPLAAWPILVKTPGALVLIESGLGNKLTDKQKNIYRVREEWSVPGELEELGISREEINFVILTHFDFDHASGVVMWDEAGRPGLTFPQAKHIIQKKEWDDVLNPNIRSVNSYWPVNIESLKGSKNLVLADGEMEVVKGVSVMHTGGHNGGHQIVTMESGSDKAFHLGDLLPTHAHINPLWVMAYDNYPLDAIGLKSIWINTSAAEHAWLTFYHDPFVLACRLGEAGAVAEKWGDE